MKIEISEKITTAIDKVVDYLGNEEEHFWESCECPDNLHERDNINLCTCEANKNHILRESETLRLFLVENKLL